MKKCYIYTVLLAVFLLNGCASLGGNQAFLESKRDLLSTDDKVESIFCWIDEESRSYAHFYVTTWRAPDGAAEIVGSDNVPDTTHYLNGAFYHGEDSDPFDVNYYEPGYTLYKAEAIEGLHEIGKPLTCLD